jgi:glycosyltransferase involved in cell wall biosynthesis
MKITQVISSNIPIMPTGMRRWGALELIQSEYQKHFIKKGHECEIKWLNDVVVGEQDVVHIHVANLCLEARDRGIPYIYSNHDHSSFYHGKGSWLYNQQLEAIKGSIFSVAHAESVVDFFSETDKLFYLPHGVDTEYYTPSVLSQRKNELLMIANNGAIGDYSVDRKGFRLGIEAAKKLNLPITVVGADSNKRFFEIHSDLLEYDGLTIDSSNPTEDKKLEYFQAHKIFLHPSSVEYGAPCLSILEAWACGLPTVAAYDGSIKLEGMEVLKALDVDEICVKINYILNHYPKITQQMRNVDRSKHDWSSVVAQLDKMYRLCTEINNQDTSETVKNKYIATYEKI